MQLRNLFWFVFIAAAGNEVLIKQAVIEGQRPRIALIDDPEPAPAFLKDMICACWDGDPNKRPDFNSMKNCYLLLFKFDVYLLDSSP